LFVNLKLTSEYGALPKIFSPPQNSKLKIGNRKLKIYFLSPFEGVFLF
jgi:hypothetical protein